MALDAFEKYIDEGVSLVQSGVTISEAARQLVSKYNLEKRINANALRVRISRRLSKDRDKNGLLPVSAQELEIECAERGIDLDTVKHYWWKGEHFSIFAKPPEIDLLSEIETLLKNYKPGKIKPKKESNTIAVQKALKATISDMHVGLDPNPDGNSLFQYEYNEDIFNHNIDCVIDTIIKEHKTYGRFEVLYLDDLGDGLDGWNGQTTRTGHKLPQNMNNVKQFNTFVSGKLRLIETVISLDVADKIICRSVSNDNHAGDFSAIANLTIQKILERVYDQSLFEFHILKRFMEHFEYGDHTFLLTHGKDKENMKFGLPKYLNDKAKSFIQSYIDHYDICSKYIHVEKGDLHCTAVERTKRYDYRNFMSFAPPSSWVQTNFGDTYSGYSIQVIPKHSGEISHADYIFEFKKARRIA